MSKFKWATLYIYYVENDKLNLVKETIIVEKKFKSYKEIATGMILKSRDYNLKDFKESRVYSYIEKLNQRRETVSSKNMKKIIKSKNKLNI